MKKATKKDLLKKIDDILEEVNRLAKKVEKPEDEIGLSLSRTMAGITHKIRIFPW